MDFIYSNEMITIPELGTYPVLQAILLLYSASFLFGFGVGYAFSFTKALFIMSFKR